MQRVVIAGCELILKTSRFGRVKGVCLSDWVGHSLCSSYERSSTKYVLDVYTTLQTAQRVVKFVLIDLEYLVEKAVCVWKSTAALSKTSS